MITITGLLLSDVMFSQLDLCYPTYAIWPMLSDLCYPTMLYVYEYKPISVGNVQ